MPRTESEYNGFQKCGRGGGGLGWFGGGLGRWTRSDSPGGQKDREKQRRNPQPRPEFEGQQARPSARGGANSRRGQKSG